MAVGLVIKAEVGDFFTEVVSGCLLHCCERHAAVNVLDKIVDHVGVQKVLDNLSAFFLGHTVDLSKEDQE